MLVGLLLLAVAPAASPNSKPDVGPAEDKVVCRSIQQAYSRIPERACKKQSEWAQMEKDAQNDWRSSRNQRGEGANPGPGN
jgi:hypothetical protein